MTSTNTAREIEDLNSIITELRRDLAGTVASNDQLRAEVSHLTASLAESYRADGYRIAKFRTA